jgi:alpha-1,2-mannosyltransferase
MTDSQAEAAPSRPFGSNIRAHKAWIPIVWTVGIASTIAAITEAILQATHRLQLDMAVYLMGSRHLVDGHLYLVSLPAPPHLPFTYPPFAALAFLLLTLLSEQGAQWVWSVVSVAALFAMLWLSLRAVYPAQGKSQRVVVALVLMTPALWIEPVHLTLGFGQINIVLAALILGDLTGRVPIGSRTLPRGVLVGIAAAVKLVPLVFVPYLFLTRQTRAGWTALGTFLGCSALAAVVSPGASWSYWTKYATDAQRVGGVFYISNQSLRAVVDRLDHHVVSTGLVTGLAGVALVLGLVLATWAYRTSTSFLGLLVCATTGLIVSPITWAHHMVWAVPVLMWLIWAPDRPAGGRMWAGAGAILFWWAPIWSVPSGQNQELAEHGWQLLWGNSFFAATVVFEVGVAVMLWRRRSDQVTGPGPDAVRPARTESLH